MVSVLASMAHLVGALSYKLKGCGFNSQSGHMPRLWVQSLVGVLMGGNRPMFLSHIDISLPLSPSLSLFLKSTSTSLSDD